MRFREESERKNFFDFRGRPGALPIKILKKEYDIRDLEGPINDHAQGDNGNPKKVHRLYWSTAKKRSL